jgi:hypothetical protein
MICRFILSNRKTSHVALWECHFIASRLSLNNASDRPQLSVGFLPRLSNPMRFIDIQTGPQLNLCAASLTCPSLLCCMLNRNKSRDIKRASHDALSDGMADAPLSRSHEIWDTEHCNSKRSGKSLVVIC